MTLWLLVAGEIRFPWVRYEAASTAGMRDAALCAAMGKMFAATSKGILAVYKVSDPTGLMHPMSDVKLDKTALCRQRVSGGRTSGRRRRST